MLDGVDAKEKLLKGHSAEDGIDAFSAEHHECHFQPVIQTKPSPAHPPFFATAVGKLKDGGAMRRNAKPLQNGSRNNGVRGSRFHKRAEGLEVPASRIA